MFIDSGGRTSEITHFQMWKDIMARGEIGGIIVAIIIAIVGLYIIGFLLKHLYNIPIPFVP